MLSARTHSRERQRPCRAAAQGPADGLRPRRGLSARPPAELRHGRPAQSQDGELPVRQQPNVAAAACCADCAHASGRPLDVRRLTCLRCRMSSRASLRCAGLPPGRSGELAAAQSLLLPSVCLPQPALTAPGPPAAQDTYNSLAPEASYATMAGRSADNKDIRRIIEAEGALQPCQAPCASCPGCRSADRQPQPTQSAGLQAQRRPVPDTS